MTDAPSASGQRPEPKDPDDWVWLKEVPETEAWYRVRASVLLGFPKPETTNEPTTITELIEYLKTLDDGTVTLGPPSPLMVGDQVLITRESVITVDVR